MRRSTGLTFICVLLGWCMLSTAYSYYRGADQENMISDLEKRQMLYKRQLRDSDRGIIRLNRKKAALETTVASLREQIVLLDNQDEINAVKTKLAEAEDILKKEKQQSALLESKVRKLTAQIKSKKTKKTYARVYYYRPDGKYYGWGVHASGRAVPVSTPWSKPIPFKYVDKFGAYAKIALHKDHKEFPLDFQVHNGPDVDCDPDPNHGAVNKTKEILHADFSTNKKIWLVSGVPKVFTSLEDAENMIAKISSESEVANVN